MQPQLTQNYKQINYFSKTTRGSLYSSEQQLEQELEEMKLSIQNLLRYCHKIEIQNKKFKRSLPSQSQILQQNNYVIGQDDGMMLRSHFLSTKSLSLNECKKFEYSQIQSQELRKTRQLYLGSLEKIQQQKNEIAELYQLLKRADKRIHEAYISNRKFESKNSEISTSNASESENSSGIFNECCDFNIQNLYCHQSLDFGDDSFRQSIQTHSNSNQNIVDSLIAKGIEFRQQRTLRSHEFRHLNTIVQKYRQQSMTQSSQFLTKKSKNSLYR